MRKKHEMVELSFRIPADGWKDLTALLLALVGSGSSVMRQRGGESSVEQVLERVREGGVEQVLERGGGKNAGFDEMAFQRLIQMEQAGEQAGMLAVEQVGKPAAERAEKQVEEQTGGLAERLAGKQTGEQEAVAQRKAAQQELMGQNLPPYRAEGWVSSPLSAPKPAAFTGEQALEQQKYDGTDEENRGERKEGVEQIDWEQRWERDCRRYDGGFTLS